LFINILYLKNEELIHSTEAICTMRSTIIQLYRVQHDFVFRIISLIFEFKTPIQPFKIFYILKYAWRLNFIFFKICFYFLGLKNTLSLWFSIIFLTLKKIEKIINNITFGLQVYINMKNTSNGWIDIFNSRLMIA
jgi:hypothetical protein